MFYLVSITKLGWEWRSLTHIGVMRARSLWLLGVITKKSLRLCEKSFRQSQSLCYIPTRSSIHTLAHTATIPSRCEHFISVSFAPFHPVAVLPLEKLFVVPRASNPFAGRDNQRALPVIVTHTGSRTPRICSHRPHPASQSRRCNFAGIPSFIFLANRDESLSHIELRRQ